MALHEVVLFLSLVREAGLAKRLTYRRTRDKNVATLTELGWLPSQMLEFVALSGLNKLLEALGGTKTPSM